jgi:hypothetical protein
VKFWREYCEKTMSEEIKCAQCKDEIVAYYFKENLKFGWGSLHTLGRGKTRLTRHFEEIIVVYLGLVTYS